MRKLAFVKDVSPTSGTAADYIYTYGAPEPLSASLTSEELTAFFTENRPSYYALKNIQISINTDGTIEAAGTIDTSYVFDTILDGKYTREDVQREMPALGLLPDNVNFYSKLAGSIRDNRLETIRLEKVGVLGITLPDSVVNGPDTASFLKEIVDGYLDRITAQSGTRLDSVTVRNGALEISGQVPSSLTRTAAAK